MHDLYISLLRTGRSILADILIRGSGLFGKCIIPSFDILVTQRCNLRCRDCISFIPHYMHPVDIDHIKIFKYFDKILDAVNSILFLNISGGESMLYHELPILLNKYKDNNKIFRITIFSNGMKRASSYSPELISALKHKKIIIILSNYGINEQNIKDLTSFFRKNGIKYFYEENKRWNPVPSIEKHNYTTKQLQRLFKQCLLSNCKILDAHQGRIHHCPRALHLDNLRFLLAFEGDFLDLSKYKKPDKELKKSIIKFLRMKYIKACYYCDEQKRTIQAGVQKN